MIVNSTHKQTTLAKEVSLEGTGLHSGQNVKLVLKPAPANHGYVFNRIDIEGSPLINASAKYVTDIQRGTILEKNGIKIMTCEHVLAALVGMEVDNVLIELNAPELPIMDGSSKFFIEKIEEAGIVEQESYREEFVVQEIMHYKDDKTGSEITLLPADEYRITAMIDFGMQIVGTQNATLDKISDFKTEISEARTFCFLHELEMLLDNNLIKGGDINSAIVYIDKEPSEETLEKLKKYFKKDSISSKPNGILDNLTLHHPNEAARHKLLDVVGDLALIGMRIRGHVIANKPGHFVNTEFAKLFIDKIRKLKKKPTFNIDLSKPPVLDVTGIMKRLPHRPPFLLVDKILELTDTDVVGLKNVTMNESFFVGHFPENPIMPGVLQIEAMAQVGGILVLGTVPDPENYLTYFMKVEKARFKRQVVPGDTLVFKLKLASPIRRGICHMCGEAYVNGNVVAEAELMAQISKVK